MDVFRGACKVDGDAETGSGATGRKEGGEELVVTVGRLDKELGAAKARGFGFEIPDSPGSRRVVDREIPIELKLLPVQAAGHEGQKNGARADEGANGRAGFVGDRGEELAGVGDAGATGFGKDADRRAARQRGAEGRSDGMESGRVFLQFVDGVPLHVVDNHFFPNHFKVPAGAAFVFDKEGGAGFDGVKDICRERGEGLLVEEGRDEIDGG